jgi:hypothetical protein
MLNLPRETNSGAQRQYISGIQVMDATSLYFLRHRESQKRRRRRSKTLIITLAVILAASICGLPTTDAFADQMLELPQVAAPAPMPHPRAVAEPDPESPNRAMAPMPPGLGSIDEYESQGDSEGPARLASGPSNLQIDPYGPQGNRSSLASNVLLGALTLGLFAMELHAAHRHHR